MPSVKRPKRDRSKVFVDRPRLTAREVQVAVGIGDGKTYDEIGSGLQLSHETVRSYVARVRDKTGRRRKAQLAIWATQQTHWLKTQLVKTA